MVLLQGALCMRLVLLHTNICYLKRKALRVKPDPNEGYQYKSVLKENDRCLLCGKNFFVMEQQECPRPPVLILLSHLGEARYASLCSNSPSCFMCNDCHMKCSENETFHHFISIILGLFFFIMGACHQQRLDELLVC